MEQRESDWRVGRWNGDEKGVPQICRSDDGLEFLDRDLCKCLATMGANTLYIEPGSPWENSYFESFNSKLRDASLNGEISY